MKKINESIQNDQRIIIRMIATMVNTLTVRQMFIINETYIFGTVPFMGQKSHFIDLHPAHES